MIDVLRYLSLKFGIDFLDMFILGHILKVIVLCLKVSLSQLSMNRLLNDGIIVGHNLLVVLLKDFEFVKELVGVLICLIKLWLECLDAFLALLLELLKPLVSLEFHASGGLFLGLLKLELEVAFGC